VSRAEHRGRHLRPGSRRGVPSTDPDPPAGSSKPQVVARTDDLSGEFVFDVDEEGRIIGIQVLDAAAVLRPETIAQLQRLETP
jgi:uncharacterized protein YuzE